MQISHQIRPGSEASDSSLIICGMKLRNSRTAQITEIMDNQESINIELDTSESLENDLNPDH